MAVLCCSTGDVECNPLVSSLGYVKFHGIRTGIFVELFCNKIKFGLFSLEFHIITMIPMPCSFHSDNIVCSPRALNSYFGDSLFIFVFLDTEILCISGVFDLLAFLILMALICLIGSFSCMHCNLLNSAASAGLSCRHRTTFKNANSNF